MSQEIHEIAKLHEGLGNTIEPNFCSAQDTGPRLTQAEQMNIYAWLGSVHMPPEHFGRLMNRTGNGCQFFKVKDVGGGQASCRCTIFQARPLLCRIATCEKSEAGRKAKDAYQKFNKQPIEDWRLLHNPSSVFEMRQPMLGDKS